jgi:hypothetical protein
MNIDGMDVFAVRATHKDERVVVREETLSSLD